MVEHSLRVLEYYRLLNILSNYAASPLGHSDCLSLKPLKELESIKAEQRLVSEMKKLLLTKGFIPLSSLVDLRPVLKKAGKRGAYLEPKELLSIDNLIRISNQVKNWICEARDVCPSLRNILDNIPACHDLAKEIRRSITEDGGISDLASPLLASIRSQRGALRRVIEKKLHDILSGAEFDDDNLVSVRDGRYVVSIKTDRKNCIRGIIHGYSRSQSTCFMEPLTVVEENNHLVELTDTEREEERRVLERLTELVSDSSSELLTCLEIMGRSDGIFARAQFSGAIGGISPIVTPEKTIYLLDALNPILLSLSLDSPKGGKTGNTEKVVPIEIKIDDEKSILIISGPNRGGKTVALKTLGLLALMSQAGMHIPAKEGSQLGVFDNILAEIGDDQDISAGLSTFSARMEHLKEIVDQAADNSLVILDELGTGTDPDEGTSLAMATLDYLSEKGSLSAISTHYQKLKRYALINKKAQNASVEFDYESSSPTFRLLTGMPGVSHAIEVAQEIGLKPEIINKAATYLGKDRGRADLVMEDLAKMIEEVKEEKEAVTVARQEYVLSKKGLDEEQERLNEQLTEMLIQKEQVADRLLSEAKREFGEAVRYLREKGPEGQFEATQRYTRAKADLMDAMAGLKGKKKSANHISITVGQPVYHKKSKKTGLVVGMDEHSSRVQIMIGKVKFTVDSSELIPGSKGSSQQEEDQEKGKQWSVSSPSPDKRELNLVGYTVADALPLVDRIIDQAVVHGYTRVKIIHGIGSGTLKKAIREHLQENFYVKDFISGGRDRGSDGITIVEL
jgi:DNA mismatch repair protein MutS2